MTATAVSSVDMVRDGVREAAARGTPLRITGRGEWLDAGRPVVADDTLSTRELAGIVEYVPGDLTLTARAGTTLAEIAEATAAHGQWLALDPHGGDTGTLGATIATASCGPLVTGFGAPRDLALGLEFVTGSGVVARGGGRVVKNVAGFDLTRLLTGSWGSLGVITEISVRLHARPAVDESFIVALGGGAGAVERVWQILRRLPFTPLACEVLNATLARHVLGEASLAAIVRLGGNPEAVAAQRAALSELGAVRETDSAVWHRLRVAEPDGTFVFRASGLPSRIERTWAHVAALASEQALVHATPARGVVRCIVPRGDAAAAAVTRAVRSTEFRHVGERLPAEAWRACRAPAADALTASLKQRFDPAGVLNRGVFGEVV